MSVIFIAIFPFKLKIIIPNKAKSDYEYSVQNFSYKIYKRRSVYFSHATRVFSFVQNDSRIRRLSLLCHCREKKIIFIINNLLFI